MTKEIIKFHSKLHKLYLSKTENVFYWFNTDTPNVLRFGKLGKVPGATQALDELLGNGASQRIFRKFIESSYVTLDPER